MQFPTYAVYDEELEEYLKIEEICCTRKRSCSFKYLLDQKIIFNLYRNDALVTEGIFYSEDDLKEWEEQHGDAFRDHLYAFNFWGRGSNKIFEFLNEKMPKGYYEVMFKKGFYHPHIGIYNAVKNDLIGIGIGRKNYLFVNSPNEDLDVSNYRNADEFAQFTEMDFGNVVTSLIDSLEEAADYHKESCSRDPEDEDQPYYEAEMHIAYRIIPIAIPTMPKSMGDEVSPGNF